MKMAQATGILFKGIIPKRTIITMRTEKTGDFATLSLSDDVGVMLQVEVTPAIKRLLKDVIK